MMRVASVCFVLLLWLPFANAAEVEKKDRLPSGEYVTDFLLLQIRGGNLKLSTLTQEKKPIQLFLEELVLDDGRQHPASKWIDDAPDTFPPPPKDLTPRGTSVTLYTDIARANAHWDDFQRRYPAVADYLKERHIRPKITHPIDPKTYAWPEALEGIFIHDQSLNPSGYKSPMDYLTYVAGCILYADFLIAYGDDAVKKDAFYYLLGVEEETLRTNGGDKNFAQLVADHIFAPMAHTLSDEKLRFRLREILLESPRGCTIPGLIQIDKWCVNHGKMKRFAARSAPLVATISTISSAVTTTASPALIFALICS